MDIAVPQRATVAFALGVGLAAQPAHCAIGKAHPIFALPWGEVDRRQADGGDHPLQVIRVNGGKYRIGVVLHVFRRQLVNVANPLAGVGEAGGAVRAQSVLIDHARHLGHQLAQARLQLGPGRFGLLAGCNVQVGAHCAQRRAGRAPVGDPALGQNPHPVAIAVQHAVF